MEATKLLFFVILNAIMLNAFSQSPDYAAQDLIVIDSLNFDSSGTCINIVNRLISRTLEYPKDTISQIGEYDFITTDSLRGVVTNNLTESLVNTTVIFGVLHGEIKNRFCYLTSSDLSIEQETIGRSDLMHFDFSSFLPEVSQLGDTGTITYAFYQTIKLPDESNIQSELEAFQTRHAQGSTQAFSQDGIHETLTSQAFILSRPNIDIIPALKLAITYFQKNVPITFAQALVLRSQGVEETSRTGIFDGVQYLAITFRNNVGDASIDPPPPNSLVPPIYGCTYLSAINYDPHAMLDNNLCEFDNLDNCLGDFTGDGVVTTSDLTQFLAVFGGTCY